MSDPAFLFACALAAFGLGFGVWLGFKWAALRLFVTVRRRYFTRVQPSRWPKVDTETRRYIHPIDMK